MKATTKTINDFAAVLDSWADKMRYHSEANEQGEDVITEVLSDLQSLPSNLNVAKLVRQSQREKATLQ